ncbi:hypothetical protein ACH429_18520 [Streptomyces pathocidini]|uniref:Uncharacterized protein n=1 Tax=Streptomyces pathocidini TaxID=1650571 RepID=A0ABW7UTX0_9ACTN
MVETGTDTSGARTVERPRPGADFGPDRSPAPRVAGDCDLVTVPARQGLEAVDILRRGVGGRISGGGAAPGAVTGAGPAVGPVLHDGSCDTLGFLVPPGTAACWDLPGSACTQTFGRGLSTAGGPPVAGTGWLVPPEGGTEVTDPAVLRAALGEAARLIEAADRCT